METLLYYCIDWCAECAYSRRQHPTAREGTNRETSSLFAASALKMGQGCRTTFFSHGGSEVQASVQYLTDDTTGAEENLAR